MDTENRGNNTEMIVTSIAFVSIFSFSFINTLSSVIINEIIDAFSLSGTRQGLVSSLLNLGLIVALMSTLLIQGRVKKLTVILFANILQLLMLLTCGFSRTFLLFSVGCTFLGVGGGLIDSYSNSCITDVHKSESPKYLGVLHGLFGVGSLLTPILVYFLLRRTSWRGIYIAIAVFMAVTVAVILILSQKANQNGPISATREHKLTKKDFIDYMKNKRNIALVLVGAFASATQTGILAWLMRYMTVRFNAEDLGSLSISIFWVCATINRFLVARIKVPPIKLLIIGAGLTALILCAGIALASPIAMCVAMGAIGFCSGHFMQALFSECAAGYEGKTTFTTSFMIFVMGIVRIITPLLMAFISDKMTVVTGMAVPVAAAVMTVIFGILAMRVSHYTSQAL